MLVISLLTVVPGAAGAQTATVVAPAATVSGVTVTNAGTYRAQSVSAPSGAGQLSPTGTVGRASNCVERYADAPAHADHHRLKLRSPGKNCAQSSMLMTSSIDGSVSAIRQKTPVL
jgi:hypothetical protein